MSPFASVYDCVLVTTLQRAKLLEDQEPEAQTHRWMTLTKIEPLRIIVVQLQLHQS